MPHTMPSEVAWCTATPYFPRASFLRTASTTARESRIHILSYTCPRLALSAIAGARMPRAPLQVAMPPPSPVPGGEHEVPGTLAQVLRIGPCNGGSGPGVFYRQATRRSRLRLWKRLYKRSYRDAYTYRRILPCPSAAWRNLTPGDKTEHGVTGC